MRMHILTSTLAAASLIAITGCAPMAPEPPSASAGYASWENYQSDLAKYLNEIVGRPNNMRVVPATNAYNIGTVVRRDSMSEVSSACRLSAPVPRYVEGPIIPSVTGVRKVKFSLDPGSLITKATPKLEAAKLSFDKESDLTASISDVSTAIVTEDDTLAVLRNPECLKAIQDKPVSVVRGYIQAKYQITSGGGVTPSAKLVALKSELVDIDFENNRKFEVRDASPRAKFMILADGVASTEIVLSGGFIQSTSSHAGCMETPVIRFGSETSKGLNGPRSYRNFRTCDAAKSYVDYLCEADKKSGTGKCRDQVGMWNLEANGYLVNYDK